MIALINITQVCVCVIKNFKLIITVTLEINSEIVQKVPLFLPLSVRNFVVPRRVVPHPHFAQPIYALRLEVYNGKQNIAGGGDIDTKVSMKFVCNVSTCGIFTHQV